MDEPEVCEDCGCKDDTVKEVNCPFAEEIQGKLVKVKLCQNCYLERIRDI